MVAAKIILRKKGEHLKKILLLKIMIILTVISFSACKNNNGQNSEEILQDTIIVETPQKDTAVLIETQVMRGEGPFNVMERLNIDRNLRQKILDTLAEQTDFTALKVGERFAGLFCLDTMKLFEFIYFQDEITTHRVKFFYDEENESDNPTTPELDYVLEEKPSQVRHRLIRGNLNSPTLDAEFRNMGLPLSVVGTATNVLECKISFRTDARIGDEFEMLLQETVFTDTIDGEVIEKTLDNRTNVLFVSYSGTRCGKHEGYRYFDGDKSSSFNAHYTEDGEALIYSGLRYPLDKIHITSTYGARRHPVTGRNTMHQGVDYRARTGTPVYAVAEGKVVISKYDDLAGNHIAIKHKDNTISYYLHLNKRGVGVGANVRARQVIGSTGNTGRSTGPHLHFGFKNSNGKWMNPLQKRMIATPKLQGEKLENLKNQVAQTKQIYAEQNEFLSKIANNESEIVFLP